MKLSLKVKTISILLNKKKKKEFPEKTQKITFQQIIPCNFNRKYYDMNILFSLLEILSKIISLYIHAFANCCLTNSSHLCVTQVDR